MKWAQKQTGFTIVELLIVVVVIAILAAITIVAYNGISEQARDSKVNTDLVQLERAVVAARNGTGKTFMQITGSGFTGTVCVNKPAGTDIAALPSTDTCWTRYKQTLDAISEASGIDVRGLLDPWGRPYRIDENEGEGGACNRDSLSVLLYPFTGSGAISKYSRSIHLSGNSGC